MTTSPAISAELERRKAERRAAIAPITERLRNLKPCQSALFAEYQRPQQLTSTFARLKPYGYRFTTRKCAEGVWVTRLPKDGGIDDLL